MAYTLLQLVDQVSGEMGLSQPTAVIGSTTNQTIQLLALAQRLGKDLVRDFEWQRLVQAYIWQTSAAVSTTGTITAGSSVITAIPSTANLQVGNVITGTGQTVYAEILTIDSATQVTLNAPVTTSTASVSMTFAKQDYALPSGFDRMISDTNWDRTNHWRNLGTKSSQEWQYLQGGIISVGPRERYRIYNNKLRIFQALTSVYNLSFEYVSNYWVVAAGDANGSKSAYTVDTDTAVFPDDLMLAGLKYYFLKAKKLDYSVELGEFVRSLSYCKAQDVPVPAMSLAPVGMNPLVGPWSIQDGNWPAM
tara:strand:+ start:217 stop:1134 length:918 start_codon:yes stop_codon:yes gene_type:complete